MVTDQEPRYRLVDADGNVVGSLFAETDGTLKLQEGTSGNDNEVSLTTQGALEAEQILTPQLASATSGGVEAQIRGTDFNKASGSSGSLVIRMRTPDGSTKEDTEIILKDKDGNNIALFAENGELKVADGAGTVTTIS